MKLNKSILGSTLALAVMAGALAPPAHATTLLAGDLFFTTFQTQGLGPTTPNLFKVSFVYDSVTGLSLGSNTPLASLKGADGLLFDPNDTTGKTLLVGEQSTAANAVGSVATDGTLLFEKTPAGATAGQAYGLAIPPSKAQMFIFPNDAGTGQFNIDTIPIPFTALSANGTTHAVTGADTFLRGGAFIGNTAYYGDANDHALDGHFGVLDTNTFVTTRVTIVDDVNPGSPAIQGGLPSHGLEFDSFSGCIILSGSTELWQLCPVSPDANGLATTFHIKAKVSTPTTCLNPNGCIESNWDQTSVDGHGHLFAANNNGDLYFIDYSGSATKSISDPSNYTKRQFLANDLDDIANGGGAPPPQPTGCPATQGFWHKAQNWPNVTATIDGVTYNGATDHSMVIGNETYTQAQLLALLPNGSLHTGGYVNALSQFIAAVINLAAGAQTGSPDLIDTAITTMNNDLNGIVFVTGNPPQLVSISSSLQTTLAGFTITLDNYNSAVGFGCTEGAGLNIGK